MGPARALPVAAVAAALLAAALAGCVAKDEPAPQVAADLITPGQWDIRGDTDRVMAWAHNTGEGDAKIAWSITSAGGKPLPNGWAVTFDPLTSGLSPAGTKSANGRGYAYLDWAMTMLTLTLPAGQAAGAFALELHAGPATTPVNATVHAERGHVSGPGSQVEVQYEGRFADSGETFDDGEFPTTLGRGDTVPGFDHGLMGLAAGEQAILVIPPPFGYGYDPPPSHAQFAGKTLAFRVTITSLQG